MELALLDAFAHYYEQGCEAEQLETAEHNYDYLQREAAEQGKLMHGSYNYHNIVFQGREVVPTLRTPKWVYRLWIYMVSCAKLWRRMDGNRIWDAA